MRTTPASRSDSRSLYREKGAGSALAAFALETGLTRRFGFEWAYRPASKGRVIAGFPEQVISQFSSRRAQITKTTLALAEVYEHDRGHAPDQRALASMRQFANAKTRRGKEAGALGRHGLVQRCHGPPLLACHRPAPPPDSGPSRHLPVEGK